MNKDPYRSLLIFVYLFIYDCKSGYTGMGRGEEGRGGEGREGGGQKKYTELESYIR